MYNRPPCIVIGHTYDGEICTYCGRLDNELPDLWDSKDSHIKRMLFLRIKYLEEMYTS